MKLKNLHIISFGKLKDKKIDFTDGLNIIYGRNESGKTTISTFIEAMLYSFPPHKTDDRKKYFPWDGSAPSGTITIDSPSGQISVYRKFGTTPKADTTTVTPPVSLEELIPSDRETYRKSVYSPEGSAKNFGTTQEINRRIANIIATGDESMDASAAIDSLAKLRRTIKPLRGSSGKLNQTEAKVTQLENELTTALRDEKRVIEIKDRLSDAKASLSECEARLNLLESGNTFPQSALDAIDTEISIQKQYIDEFPKTDSSKPPTFSVNVQALLFSIICALILFIIGIIMFFPLVYFSLVPVLIFGIIFALNKRKFQKSKKLFLSLAGCTTTEEYEHMLTDKQAALDHLNALLDQKAAISADFQSSSVSARNSILKSMLTLKDEISVLTKELSLFNNRSTDSISEDLAYYREEKATLLKKLKAIDTAIDAITYAKERISKDFTPLIADKAMEYLNLIAPKNGRSVTLSPDLTLSLSDPYFCDISSSSFGFREEMYLCFRIALSEFLYPDNFPLIFDDPFSGSDDYRSQAIFNLFNRIAENRQIIIFTNRKNDYFSQSDCNFVDISPFDDV